MKKEPTLKQLTMAFAIILAVVLYSAGVINWRDALLIIALPITLFHLLFVFIISISKPVITAGEDADTQDKIYELGKMQVHYERQLVLHGKEKADLVLHFWMKGFKHYSMPKKKATFTERLSEMAERRKAGDE